MKKIKNQSHPLKMLCMTMAVAGLFGAALPAGAQAIDGNQNASFGSFAGAGVSGSNNAAIGTQAGNSVNGNSNTAIGTDAGTLVTGDDNTAYGTQAGFNVNGSNNLSNGTGSGNFVNGYDNIATGRSAGTQVSGDSNIASGTNAGQRVSGYGNVATGADAGTDVTGDSNTASGRTSGVNVIGSGNNAIGIFAGRNVNGDFNNAIGLQAGYNVQGGQNNAIGLLAGVNVVGYSNNALGTFAGFSVQGNDNVSIGTNANMGGIGSQNIVIGVNAQPANVSNAVVIGTNASVTVDGAVALGSGSTAGAGNAGWAGTVVNGQVMTNNAAQTVGLGVVSVGDIGAYRQITNVADGAVDATSTDAVNGSQLYKSIQAVGAAGAMSVQYSTPAKDAIMLGGATGTTISNLSDGVVASGSKDAVNGGQLYTTNQAVAANTSSISTLTTRVDDNTNSINALSSQSATSNQAIADNSANISNLTTKVTTGTIGLTQQAGGVSTGALTVGSATGGTVVDFTGTSGARVLSGVANGVNATDAVNFSQYNALVASTANAVNYDDASKTKLTLGGAGGTVIGNVKAGSVSASSMEAVNGSQLNAVKAVADNSVQYSAGGTSVQLNANAGAGTTVDNVADGSVAAGSKQAVNGGQLNQTNQSINALSMGMNGANSRIDALGQTVQENQIEARRGIAAAMALSGAPMPSAAGKTAWAFNAANFKGQSALAASISHRIKSANALAVNAGVTASSGAAGIRIGLSGEF